MCAIGSMLGPMLAGAVAAGLTAGAAMAQDVQTYTTKKPFDDVRFELGNAVVARGFAIQSEGNIAKMLERTAADVGATKQVYKSGEYVQFCSAKYTRMMVEADPANFGNCPFMVFVYETVATPGEVVAGYRKLGIGKGETSRKVFAEIEAMLDGIVKDTLK